MTTAHRDGIYSNMKPRLVAKERLGFGENAFADVAIFEVPNPKLPSKHYYKYRLAYVVDEICVLRFDNEAGKGDHKHIGKNETEYVFIDLDSLINDFYAEIKNWNEKGRSDENTYT